MADNVPFLIINPNAKDKRLGKKLDRILESAKNAFGDFQYELTTKIGDGIPIAKKAISEGYNTLVSVGGDGTLNEIINVTAKTDVKVGMIPGGSACDSLKTHGIPNDFDRAFEIVAEGYHERFPVGQMKGDTDRYFIEMVNGGFIGETAAALADRYEWASGEIAYGYVAIKIIMGFKPIPTKITIDGKIKREDNFSTLAIALTDCIAGFEFIPDNHPRLDDFGIIFSHHKGMKLIKLLLKAVKGNHLKNTDDFEILRGKHIVVESDIPHTWESEGEIPSRNATRIEVNYIPDAVNLIIPEGWKYGKSSKERNAAKKRVFKHQQPFPEND